MHLLLQRYRAPPELKLFYCPALQHFAVTRSPFPEAWQLHYAEHSTKYSYHASIFSLFNFVVHADD
jgi:hypothetical protein